MTEIYVKLEPGSSEFKVEEGRIPLFRLENPAESGRANAELLSRIEDLTGEEAVILSGHRSRRKKIRTGMEEKEFRSRIRGEEDG